MGKHLDLEDVAAGNPVAEEELAELQRQLRSADRAGFSVSAELEAAREREQFLRRSMINAGMCPDCGQVQVMDHEEPVSYCACGQGEDYGKRPLQTTQLRVLRAEAECERLRSSRDKWKAVASGESPLVAPPPEGEQWEYYYKRKDCPARYATDPHCICWYPEGTGPRPNERHDDDVPVVEWRKAMRPAPSDGGSHENAE